MPTLMLIPHLYYTAWHAWMDTHGIRKVFFTYQADCMLFGAGPLMKVFFNVSREAPNYMDRVNGRGSGRDNTLASGAWSHLLNSTSRSLYTALLHRPSLETACIWKPSTQLSTSQCKVHAGQKGAACTVSTA